jgi:hypothetical protein
MARPAEKILAFHGKESPLLDVLMDATRKVAKQDPLTDLQQLLFIITLSRVVLESQDSALAIWDNLGQLAGTVIMTAGISFDMVNRKIQNGIFESALRSAEGNLPEAARLLRMEPDELEYQITRRYPKLSWLVRKWSSPAPEISDRLGG